MVPLSSRGVTTKLASVEGFFSRAVEAFKRRLAELDAQIDPLAVPRAGDALHQEVQEAITDSVTACRRFEQENADDPALIRDVQQGFRNETAAWFDRSWIAHRARSKPSGFAGDYEMLVKLYEEATPARGLGGYLDVCILDLPLARAVRARLAAAREFLIREVQQRPGATRVLDIASGPCFEYKGWPTIQDSHSTEVIAIDNDPTAIDFVNRNIAAGCGNLQLKTVRYNALRTRSANATVRNFGRFDVIYSVGLFDYLSDDQLIPIFSALRETLNPGGVLYISFKDMERYDKTPYQWHLDWFFFQRTVGDCLRLFREAGFERRELEMQRDATGIIVNFVSRRDGSRLVRTDLPEHVIMPSALPAPLPENVLGSE